MDITCAHCGEPNDVYGLRHDSIGYLDDDQADMLDPLGPVDVVVAHLVETGGESDQTIAQTLAEIELPELTLAALFSWWWTGGSDPDGPATKAAKRVVETAIYLATLHQKGCPSCGWAHKGPGEHADTTQRELVFGGVTDLDPAMFLH